MLNLKYLNELENIDLAGIEKVSGSHDVVLKVDVGQKRPLIIIRCRQVLYIDFSVQPENESDLQDELYFVGEISVKEFSSANDLVEHLGRGFINLVPTDNLNSSGLEPLSKVFLLSLRGAVKLDIVAESLQFGDT